MCNSTRQIVQNSAKPGDGIFLASCLNHGMSQSVTIKVQPCARVYALRALGAAPHTSSATCACCCCF